MLLKALACDFDGTLASEDKIGQAAREALEGARRAGLRLILVTGRTFFELTRVCDCLELFDAVVAANGAVLYHPGSAMLSEDGPAPPDALLREHLRPDHCLVCAGITDDLVCETCRTRVRA